MYRSSPDTRWRLGYVCVGVAALLLFDLFATSEALLFGRSHPLLATGRGAAVAMAAPLFALAALRHPHWHIDFTVARRAVFRSAALLGVGIYLIAVAAGGSVLSALGGGWGPVPQMALLSAGVLAAAALFLSRRLRSWLRHGLARLFLSRRYDYRAEWQRFVRTVHSPVHGETLRERALRAVADVVDSPRAGLWLRVGDVYGQVIRLGLEGTEHEVPADARFARELGMSGGRPLQLDRSGVRNLVWLPDWLREVEAAWLVVPLLHRRQLAGFIVLGRPQVRIDFGWEDEELLRIVAQQAASYLAEEAATRALEEERRFQEVSRRLAFLAHDLRNLANQFSLMLANARRHIDKPEFQQDLFATMEESVASMHRLLDGIRRERGSSPGGGDAASADLAALVQRFVDAPPADGPELRASLPSTCAVRADRDRLAGITGHLIRNAIEAAGLGGHVDIVLRSAAGNAVLEIRDDGPGMSSEFLRDRLHHPFHSTKEGGYGLGLYQCREVAKELGGSLEIESTPGRGTTARLSLPLPPMPSDDG
jgi:putative PEP-CTERM system histidine kinase